jgi:hypothetical protein
MSSDPANYTNPLGGHEVLADVLGQIRRRLTSDCNMRATDGYSGGYSGKITIELRLHAVRTTTVEMEIPIVQSADVVAPPADAFPSDDVEPVEIHEVIGIPVEENLLAVRDRINDNSESAIEAETEKAEEAEAEQAPEEHRAKRKYTRRAALAGAVSE